MTTDEKIRGARFRTVIKKMAHGYPVPPSVQLTHPLGGHDCHAMRHEVTGTVQALTMVDGQFKMIAVRSHLDIHYHPCCPKMHGPGSQ